DALMDVGDHGADQPRVPGRVWREEADPLIHTRLAGIAGGGPRPVDGAYHLRRRHAGSVGRLMVRRGSTHLLLRAPLQRGRRRPAPVRGLQPPRQSLLTASDRAVREPRCTTAGVSACYETGRVRPTARPDP